MKNVLPCLFLFLFGVCSIGYGQAYKIRTIGLGFFGDYGALYPVEVDPLGTRQLIEPAYPLLNQLPSSFNNVEGQRVNARHTYSIGGWIHYKHSLGKSLVLTLEGGYARTQLTTYLLNRSAEPSPFGQVNAFHDWYNVENTFRGFKLGFPLNNRMGAILSFGYRFADIKLTDPLINRDVSSSYKGIVASGERGGNNGYLFMDQVEQNVRVLSPNMDLVLQFGRYKSHALSLGLAYHYAKDKNLITSQFVVFENGVEIGRNQINYDVSYLSAEVSYTIPLIRSRKSFGRGNQRRTTNPPPPPVTPKPDPPQPEIVTPPVDPQFRPILDDLDNCFGIDRVDDVKYQENYFRFTDEKVEFEVYHKDGQADGDRVSVCVKGRMVLKNLELTEAGKRFVVNTGERDEVDILIYTHNTGTEKKNSLGISLLSGGQVQTIELDAPEGKYFWFRMKKQQ